jgi:type IV pilus assembly protein PilQ
VSKRKQIITSIFMGGAVAALSVTNVNAAQPAPAEKVDPTNDLVAQTPPAPPAPTQQPLVPNPKVTIDNAPTNARAIAPPVGDISVSNIDGATPQVNLDSSARINMVLKNTPAREVLESLARSANLNLAYSNAGDVAADGKMKPDPMVTINLRNEPVQNAFNYVLQLSGLEAMRTGNTVFVGRKLPDSVQETVVRTLRMNQISADSAAGYLAAQGAEVRISSVTEKIEVGVPSKDLTGVSATGVGAQSVARVACGHSRSKQRL